MHHDSAADPTSWRRDAAPGGTQRDGAIGARYRHLLGKPERTVEPTPRPWTLDEEFDAIYEGTEQGRGLYLVVAVSLVIYILFIDIVRFGENSFANDTVVVTLCLVAFFLIRRYIPE